MAELRKRLEVVEGLPTMTIYKLDWTACGDSGA